MKDKSCKIKLAGKVGCYRITVSEPYNIPSRSEIIIEEKASISVLRQADLCVIEPLERIIRQENVLMPEL